MTIKYAATFEFTDRAPVTTRGTVAASTMPTCFARAGRAAVKAHPGLKWSSMVIVLLERLDPLTETRSPSGRYGLPGDVHPVDVAILGGDPSL